MITSPQEQQQLPDFTRSDESITNLLTHLHEISDLGAISALVSWDQNTALPEQAGEVRGLQQATLQGVLHERWTSSEIARLLEQLESKIQDERFNEIDRALIRETRREYDHATKLPRALVQEIARVEAGSFEAWKRARERNDFESFAPWLARTISLQREIADRFGYTETRYDALLDLFEEGLTASKVDRLFAPVREVSSTLLRRIQESGHQVDTTCIEGSFSADKQLQLCDKLLRGIGYDFSRGGMAVSPHPFTTSFGSPYDVRLTVRTFENFFQSSIMAAVHEGGHALYEQGVSPKLLRTSLAGGASMGAHESQSRLWENYIGRSEPYWQGQVAAVREVFPERFASVEPATFARALNCVQPSLIRVEADEVTYNLHIIIRFELERELVNGNLAIESLPRLWNAKYQEYLGITPDSDANGVMQDVHWTSGFGYFPSYTLGNLYGAQIYDTLRATFPDFDARLTQGDTAFALNWLREHMYVFGSTYLPEDLVTRVTGEAPNPSHFVHYLTKKFSAIYNLPA